MTRSLRCYIDDIVAWRLKFASNDNPSKTRIRSDTKHGTVVDKGVETICSNGGENFESDGSHKIDISELIPKEPTASLTNIAALICHSRHSPSKSLSSCQKVQDVIRPSAEESNKRSSKDDTSEENANTCKIRDNYTFDNKLCDGNIYNNMTSSQTERVHGDSPPLQVSDVSSNEEPCLFNDHLRNEKPFYTRRLHNEHSQPGQQTKYWTQPVSLVHKHADTKRQSWPQLNSTVAMEPPKNLHEAMTVAEGHAAHIQPNRYGYHDEIPTQPVWSAQHSQLTMSRDHALHKPCWSHSYSTPTPPRPVHTTTHWTPRHRFVPHHHHVQYNTQPTCDDTPPQYLQPPPQVSQNPQFRSIVSTTNVHQKSGAMNLDMPYQGFNYVPMNSDNVQFFNPHVQNINGFCRVENCVPTDVSMLQDQYHTHDNIPQQSSNQCYEYRDPCCCSCELPLDLSTPKQIMYENDVPLDLSIRW